MLVAKNWQEVVVIIQKIMVLYTYIFFFFLSLSVESSIKGIGFVFEKSQQHSPIRLILFTQQHNMKKIVHLQFAFGTWRMESLRDGACEITLHELDMPGAISLLSYT